MTPDPRFRKRRGKSIEQLKAEIQQHKDDNTKARLQEAKRIRETTKERKPESK